MTGRRTDWLWALAGVVLTALAAVVAVSNLRMEGDFSRTLAGHSETAAAYRDFERRFGPTREDIFLLIQADALGPRLVELENLLIELQFVPGVAGVVSVLSLPDPEMPARPFLLNPELADRSGDAQLALLRQAVPAAASMLSDDLRMTLVSVFVDPAAAGARHREALEAAFETAAPALRISEVGLPAMHRDIAEALVRDQLVLTPLAIGICLALTLLLFGSWRAMLACGAPPVMGLVCALGLFAATGRPIDVLTAMVPTVLVVLGFSDSVHFYHAVQRAQASGHALADAVRTGLRETWPALVLTTATTALAFLTLVYAGSPSLTALAFTAITGLALMLGAVLIGLPVATRLAGGGAAQRPAVQFGWARRVALAALPRWRAVALTALVLLALFAGLRALGQTEFIPTAHVPRTSDFRDTLARLETAMPGSDRLYVVVAAADPAAGIQPEDAARLGAVAREIYDTDVVAETGLGNAPEALPRRFAAEDGSGFALPVAFPLGGTGTEIRAAAEALELRLDRAGLAGTTGITGYSLMAAIEVPELIEALRFGFYAAIALFAILAIALMGSVRIAFASLVPNLLPILGVEAWLVLTGKPLTLTGGIAMTVAFGIAVDDTIHLLNRLRLEHGRQPDAPAAVRAALTSCLSPVMITSLILLVGFSATHLSLLPSVAQFGQLVAAAVGLAVLGDLLFFPSLLLWAMRKDRS